MRLTEQQVRFFEMFGFLGFPGLFAGEADKITEAFEQVWADHGGGHYGQAHDRERRSALLPFVDRSEYLSSLLDDPRIEGVIGSLLGDDFNYTASDGNFYVGDTPWHSDGFTRHPKYTSIKIAFYLDPVTRDTGCLRVIPGSHKLGDQFAGSLQEGAPSSKEGRLEELLGVHGSEVPAVPLETEPGDMLLFDHRTKHSSFGGHDQRRMFTMNFVERFREEDLKELREDIASLARFWTEEPYGEAMLRTASPARMVHLEQQMANADHLPALARKARAEMTEPSRG